MVANGDLTCLGPVKNLYKSVMKTMRKGKTLNEIDFPKELQTGQRDLSFLRDKKMKTRDEKKNYVIYLRSLKQVLDQGPMLAKVHRAIELNQEAWLRLYIDMNAELRKRTSQADEQFKFLERLR